MYCVEMWTTSVVALPVADRLVGLDRVVEDRLRPVLGLDDRVRVREPGVEVAARVAARLVDELAAGDRLVGVEQRLALVPFDCDRLDRRRAPARSCRPRRRRRRRRGSRPRLSRKSTSSQDSAAWTPGRASAGVRSIERTRRAKRAGCAAPRCAASPAGGRRRCSAPRPRARWSPSCRARRPADHLERPGGPLVERVLLDDGPDLLVAALDLLLGPDQSRHVAIASSMFGYAPQRQRLPAMPCRISSRVGSGLASTSAAAETICPGVQKPHWRASARTNACDERVLAQALDRRHLALADRVGERDAGEDGHAVELDGAGAAVTLAAGDLRPRQAEVVPEHVRERAPDRRVDLVGVAVDRQLRQPTSPPGRSRDAAAGTRCGRSAPRSFSSRLGQHPPEVARHEEELADLLRLVRDGRSSARRTRSAQGRERRSCPPGASTAAVWPWRGTGGCART